MRVSSATRWRSSSLMPLIGLLQGRARGHVVRVGVDLHRLEVGELLAGEGVELGDGLDLVAEQADAPGPVLQVGGEELDHVAADPEQAAGEVDAEVRLYWRATRSAMSWRCSMRSPTFRPNDIAV